MYMTICIPHYPNQPTPTVTTPPNLPTQPTPTIGIDVKAVAGSFGSCVG